MKPVPAAPVPEEPQGHHSRSIPPNLVTKLAEVMKLVGRVQKRGHNDYHDYDYATEGDLLDEVRPLLAERNVIVLTSLVSTERSLNEAKEQGKKPSYLTDVRMSFTFMDGDSGQNLTVEFPGCGEDSADKGIYKAITGAEKYFVKNSFMIATGDDPEHDNEEPKGKQTPKPPAPETANENGGETVTLQGVVEKTFDYPGKDKKTGKEDGTTVFNAEINGRKVWTKFPVLGAELLDASGTEVIATLKPSKNQVNLYQLLTLELPDQQIK